LNSEAIDGSSDNNQFLLQSYHVVVAMYLAF